MSDAEVSNDVRGQLLQLCRSRRTRTAVFTRARPTHWAPGEVRHPDTGEAFTQDGAWEFVAAQIAGGVAIEAIALDKPPGKTGYVIKLQGFENDSIYIKLQLGSGVVVGRSFHVSTQSK